MKVWQLLLRYLLELGWETMNFSYTCLQKGCWFVSGTYWQFQQSLQNYNTSAQVFNIQGKFKFDEYLAPAKKSDFLLTHERFENPEYVLQDHVTLYAINRQEAIFIEAPVGYELWRAKYSPFIMTAQFKYAKKVIVLPIDSFHHLADQRGDPSSITFFTNTARCGSTLVTQMFEATGQVVSISEPSALNVLASHSEAIKRKDPELEKLVVSTVRMLCKPTKNKEVGYVLKLTAPALPQLDKLAPLFPKASCLFMYRDAIKVTQSIYRLSEELPSVKTIYTFGTGSGRRVAFLLSQMGMASEYMKPFNVRNYFTLGLVFNHICHLKYLEFRKAGLNIAATRYEDVVKDPTGSMRIILQYCNLPTDRVDQCKKALEVDSQAGTCLAGEVLYRHATLKYEGEAKKEADEMSDKLGLPRPDQLYIAPETITYRESNGS